MMVYGSALRSSHRLSNRRGAAFLLAVYLASLMFLLLGGVSLQRSVIEQRAAGISRDMTQSYWMGEATLDTILTRARQGQLSVLQNGQCNYGDLASTGALPTTISGANATQGGYTLCRLDDTLYDLKIMGIQNQAIQRLHTAFEVRDSAITYKHAMYSQDSLTLDRVLTGAVDTGFNAGVLTAGVSAPVLGVDAHGHPIVTSALLEQGGIATKSTTQHAITLLNQSYVAGRVQTGPGVEPSTVISQSADSTITITPPTPLTTDLTDLPPIDVPSGTPWLRTASGRTVDAGGNFTLVNGYDVIPAGTYKTNNLTLMLGSTLTTDGPVKLYVTGPIYVSNSRFYGEPTAATAFACNPATEACVSSKNLQIFAKPSGSPLWWAALPDQVSLATNSVVGAAIYAPDMPIRMSGYSLVIGGVLGKSVETYQETYGTIDRAFATVLFDLDLGRQPTTIASGRKMASLRFYKLEGGDVAGAVAGTPGSNPSVVTTPNQGGAYYGGGGGGCYTPCWWYC